MFTRMFSEATIQSIIQSTKNIAGYKDAVLDDMHRISVKANNMPESKEITHKRSHNGIAY
jgi:hypothetical protein